MWNLIKSLLAGKSNQPIASAPVEEETVIVDVSLMNAAFPDHSAGRWCAHCEQWGAHHTDTHNDFAKAALDMAAYAPANGHK